MSQNESKKKTNLELAAELFGSEERAKEVQKEGLRILLFSHKSRMNLTEFILYLDRAYPDMTRREVMFHVSSFTRLLLDPLFAYSIALAAEVEEVLGVGPKESL